MMGAMKYKLFGLVVLSLAGCATPAPQEPIIQTIEVRVPVPVRCTPDLGAEPDYPDVDSELAVASLFRGIAILKAGRLMRIARDAEKSAALKLCSGE